jgi:hypothetical protein
MYSYADITEGIQRAVFTALMKKRNSEHNQGRNNAGPCEKNRRAGCRQ